MWSDGKSRKDSISRHRSGTKANRVMASIRQPTASGPPATPAAPSCSTISIAIIGSASTQTTGGKGFSGGAL
jgi:hypothetical protein